MRRALPQSAPARKLANDVIDASIGSNEQSASLPEPLFHATRTYE
jgi:hypothetical protein